MTNCAGLAEATTTSNGDLKVKFTNHVNQLERLLHNHARNFTTEKIIDSAVIDTDAACAFCNKNARSCSLSSAGAVILCCSHKDSVNLVENLQLQCLRLLGRMRMLVTRIHFELLEHCTTQGSAGQHTLDRQLEHTIRSTINQLFKAE